MKRKTTFLLLIPVLAATVILNCSRQKEDVLIGCFKVEAGLKFKIDKNTDQYFFTILDKDNPSESEKMYVPPREDLQALFEKDTANIKSYLVGENDSFGIFQIKDTDKFMGEKPKSEFFVLMGFLQMYAEKTECE
ncbi:MAG: hypothetical protein JXK07_01795 [Spirochaetes bacterium]|nr:hypothetical protein [Spirochaetota bacterium]MBN2770742.1 hypothetical protein [Spirochaetota bacterium]